jgi:hypothetical protein
VSSAFSAHELKGSCQPVPRALQADINRYLAEHNQAHAAQIRDQLLRRISSNLGVR